MNNKLSDDIMSLLVPKEELNKKQVALFLTQDKIDKLDEIVKTLSSLSNGRVNRNVLIELAINNLIECIPEVLNKYEKSNNIDESNYDTILCPAQNGGQDFLINNKRWEFVRLNSQKIKYLKYIALYVGAPHSKIMYYAKITDIKSVSFGKQEKYIIYVDDIKEIKPGIPLGDAQPLAARSIHYTTLNKILCAKEYKDII